MNDGRNQIVLPELRRQRAERELERRQPQALRQLVQPVECER